MKITTLCYLEKNGAYLMLHRNKKEHDENAGLWLGVGGKLEEGESPEDCLLREVREETGFSLTAYRLRGVVTFVSTWTEHMFLYTADAWTGEQAECSEGDLVWVDCRRVPALELWEGDRIFLRLLGENVPFFTLKLEYDGSALRRAVLNGRELEL